jgi:hypothetical protein
VTASGLRVSRDAGATWQPCRLGFEPGSDGGNVVALALAPDDAQGRSMFVATTRPQPDGGGELVLWRSADGGQHWDRWLAQRDTPETLLPLAVTPGLADDRLVFVGRGSRVLKPLRGAWRSVEVGDGAVTVSGLAVSPGFAEDRTVFIATSGGVFVSGDAGDSYHAWNDGLMPPHVVAVTLSPGYRQDRLVYVLGVDGTIWRRPA